MKELQPHDVVVRFDETTQELVVYGVQSDADAGKENGAISNTGVRWKEAVRLSATFFADKGAQASEQTLGALVFALLDKERERKQDKLSIRAYADQAKHAEAALNKELLDAAASGDAEAQYLLFVEHHSTAIMQRKVQELDLAEVMLNASADAGFAEAIDALKEWPEMKEQARKRIAHYLENEK